MAQDLFDLLGRIRIDSTGLENAIQQAEQGARDIQSKLGNIGQSATQMGTSLTASATLPLVGVGAAAINAAVQADNAMAQIKNATGATTAATEEMVEAARNIYKDGYGQSLDEITATLIEVKNNIHGLNEADLEKVTKNTVNLSKSFDATANEISRATYNMMEGFGISAEKAQDLMAKAAQSGVDFSKEFFDNTAEYSSLFANMGYTAEEYFGILERGSKAGVYNLDYVNDVMKEFQIRIKDGSKATSDAMDQMSADTQKVWQDMLVGKATVADVAAAIIPELQAMDDQVAAGNIGVGLFGTKWEDLESKAMYAMLGTNAELKNFNGAMEEMNKTSEETFGQKWQSFLRTAQDSLLPVGIILLDLANKYLPIVAGWIEKVANAFAGLPEEGQKAIVIFGMIAAAIGPLLIAFGAIASGLSSVMGLFGSFIGGIGSFVGAFGRLGGLFSSILGPVSSFAGIFGRIVPLILRFVPGIGMVITALSVLNGAFKMAGIDILSGLKQGLFEGEGGVLGAILDIGDKIIKFFTGLFGIASPSRVFMQFGQWIMQGLANGIRSMINAVTGLFSSVFNSMKKIASSALSSIRSTASSAFGAITGAARSMGSNIKSAVSGAFSSALSSAKGFATRAVSLGSDIAGGIAKGVSNGAKKVGNAISSLSKKALGVFKKDNKIQSPSKVYEQEASWLPAGIKNAIDKGTPIVSDAMSRLSAAAKDKFGGFDLGGAVNVASDLFGFELPNIDIPNDLPSPTGGGGMPMPNGGGGFVIQGDLVVQVQQVTDLDPRLIQNAAERVFFAEARAKE